MIKSVPSGSDRELTVFVDEAGRSIGLADRVGVMRDARSRTAASVVAAIDSSGGVHGLWTEAAIAYPSIAPDPAALRAMRDRVKSDASSRPLTAAEQRKVIQVIAFLRKRCPA